LRSEHIYFDEGIQVIDCIEFNDRFRYGDAVADLAFLHMDLEHRGHAELSRTLLAAYVEEADDPQLYALLDFYAAYRAVVKLKVAGLRSAQLDSSFAASFQAEAQRYLDDAYRYALRFSRPTLWVFCGLPASGKTALARQAAEDLEAVLVQSDAVRKEAGGCPMARSGVMAYGAGMYRPEIRQHVYSHVLERAQTALKKGASTIVDATFAERKWRQQAQQLAVDLDSNFILVECLCRDETLRKRLKLREFDESISDARLQHLPFMLRHFEPVTELSPEQHLRIDTDQPFLKSLDVLLSSGYALQCAQVEALRARLG
jgi:hypothetical protein